MEASVTTLAKDLETPTVQQRADEAVCEGELEFRRLADAMQQLVWMARPDGHIFWYNQRWYEYTGATPEKMEGWGWQSAHDPARLEEVMKRWKCSLEAGQPFEMTFPLRGEDGRYRPFLTRADPVRDAAGRITRWIGTNTDISREITIREELESSRKRLEAALTASQRLAAIVESSVDAIVSKDLNGVVTSWNPSAERMFGYSAEEMIGRSIKTIIPPELHGDEERFLATIGRGDRIENFETYRHRKDGKRIEVSLTLSPVRDEAGRIVGAAKIARDITKRKEVEEALHVNERLAAVGRLASTIAHEVNNPLEAITNLVYLARANTAETETHLLLERVERELERVSLLTRQTLGFYRQTKRPASTSLAGLVLPLIAVLAARAGRKEVTIEHEILADPVIECVAGEIQQIFANLLNNGIDAVNNGGRIRVRVSRAREWAGECRTGGRLTIADSGRGVPVDVRSRLFEPFFTTKENLGTGLGLWVCKTIVQKHGGRISLKSSVRRDRSWTVFSVFLPEKAPTITQAAVA